jgi:hypothetical protein
MFRSKIHKDEGEGGWGEGHSVGHDHTAWTQTPHAHQRDYGQSPISRNITE